MTHAGQVVVPAYTDKMPGHSASVLIFRMESVAAYKNGATRKSFMVAQTFNLRDLGKQRQKSSESLGLSWST